ncbi:MAG: hypothetical protein CMJ19_02525 [Phycisphaeraceae bacterium]|nr:hypothetical protein [Phycisphaeraceae bacterium]
MNALFYHFIRTVCFLLVSTAIMLGCTHRAYAADRYEYVWSANGLYRGTHPVSKNPWQTDWVNNPDGGKSIKVTVTRGTGYYNYIVIPRHYLKTDAMDFTAEVTFRVTESTTLPRTFYMFARNSKSSAYDIWQRWVGEPDGKQRTIKFPMRLTPVDGGKWTIYAGCQGTGGIIYDKIAIKTGRDIEHLKPQTDATLTSQTDSTGKALATGFTEIQIIRPDDQGQGKVISAAGRLIADGDQPVSNEVAENNSIALQRMVNEARSIKGNKTILIPRGVYRFARKASIILDHVDDLTIDGQGSEFIFQKLYQGDCFLLMQCNRVVIKNLFIDWNWDYMPIASLGTVAKASDDSKTFEFTFADCNEQQIQKAAQMKWLMLMPIDADKLYRKRDEAQPEKFTINDAKPKLEVKGDRIIAQFPRPVALAEGQSYIIRHLYYNLIAFKIASGSHLTFEDVTIYSLPGMGWLNTGTTHHWRFNRCRIVRREGSRHPLTTAADGIHAGESKGNVIIENCEFTGLGDDCINLHDNTWQGGLKFGDHDKQLKLLNCPKHRLRIAAGDVLRFYNADLSPTGIELTVAQEPIYDGHPNAYVNSTTTTIDFKQTVPRSLSYLAIVANTRFATDNVRIANNRFVRTFGRGILYSGNDVTVENNVFDRIGGNAIQVQADIVDLHWAEGVGTDNMVIRNNRFSNVNPSGRWEGAVIYTGGRLPWGPMSYPLFKRFLVENNHFINPPGPAMSFTASRDMVIRNNIIDMTNPLPNVTPYAGTVFNALCSQVRVHGNLWKSPQPESYPGGVVFDPDECEQIQVDSNRLEIIR